MHVWAWHDVSTRGPSTQDAEVGGSYIQSYIDAVLKTKTKPYVTKDSSRRDKELRKVHNKKTEYLTDQRPVMVLNVILLQPIITREDRLSQVRDYLD